MTRTRTLLATVVAAGSLAAISPGSDAAVIVYYDFEAASGFNVTSGSDTNATFNTDSNNSAPVPSLVANPDPLYTDGGAQVVLFPADGDYSRILTSTSGASAVTRPALQANELYRITFDLSLSDADDLESVRLRLEGFTSNPSYAGLKDPGLDEWHGTSSQVGSSSFTRYTMTLGPVGSSADVEITDDDFDNRLRFHVVGDPAGAVYLDNVLFEVVPEPASLALLGVGCVLIASRRCG